MPAANDCLTSIGQTAAHARHELLLLLPVAECRRSNAAGDHTRQSKVNLPGRRGRDAADRQCPLADLGPPWDISLIGRSLLSQALRPRECFLAQLGGVDR